MIAAERTTVKHGEGFIAARLAEARDTRDFCIRQVRRAEAQHEQVEAAGWWSELRAVEREIRALTADRGY
jgi:hypothetical protein